MIQISSNVTGSDFGPFLPPERNIGFLEIVGTLVLILLIIWLGLAIFSRLQYWRAIGRPFFGRPILHHSIHPFPFSWYKALLAIQAFRLSLKVKPISTSSWYKALRAAQERRVRLMGLLEFTNGLNSDIVPFEFIEFPPFDFISRNPGMGELIERIPRRFTVGDPAGYWHTTYLQWQLQEDHYLLAERVVDALVILKSTLFNHTGSEFVSSVSLKPLNPKQHQKEFPWRVVIATAYPSDLSNKLSEIRNWLGIGVEFAPAVPIKPLGRCKEGNGLNGVVAGKIVTSRGIEYGITCRHVISSTCPSLHWPKCDTNTTLLDVPDVALIKLKSDCPVSSSFLLRFIPFKQKPYCFVSSTNLSHSITHSKLNTGAKVIKSPNRNNQIGLVEAQTLEFTMNNTIVRGPYVLITPEFYSRFGIIWPLLLRRFSSRGDSGSWVIDIETGDWGGMVVCGMEAPKIGTYAIQANYLLDVFKAAEKWSGDLDSQIFDRE